MPNSDIKARNYVKNTAGVWTPVGYGVSDVVMPVTIGNPNSAFAGMFASISTFGALLVSMDPILAFSDSYEGVVVDTINRWSTAGTVPPAQTQGLLTINPGATANATSTIASQFAFPTASPLTVGTSITLEAGTIALGNHRFWGLGTPPSVPGTAAAPLRDAVGFEIDTAGVLRASVYSGGTRVFTSILVIPTDGAPHRYAVLARGDIAFWYKDAFDLPIASTFIGPASQVLPVRFASLNSASVTGTPTMSTTGLAVMDTSRSAQGVSDGTYPWRKAKVDSLGNQNIALQGLAGTAASIRPDSYLRVTQDPSPLLFDVFDTALDTVNRWTASGTAPTTANGTLTLNQGTTATTNSSVTSVPTFPVMINMFNTTNALVTVDSGLKTGAYRFVGLGVLQGAPTVAAPLVNAVGFEWLDTTGVLSGVVWSGGSRTQSVSLASVQPTDGAVHRYLMYYKSSRVYFEIDAVQVGSIAYPAPQVSNLPMVMTAINGASTVSPAAVMTSTFLGVADSGHNSTFIADATSPWRKAKVDATGALTTATRGSDLAVSATGTAAAAVTATLPAAGVGLYHYISSISFTKYATAAITGSATPIVVTTTNLPGSYAYTFDTAEPVGAAVYRIDGFDSPLRSSVANTATTIVCPSVTSIIWRVSVNYYAAP